MTIDYLFFHPEEHELLVINYSKDCHVVKVIEKESKNAFCLLFGNGMMPYVGGNLFSKEEEKDVNIFNEILKRCNKIKETVLNKRARFPEVKSMTLYEINSILDLAGEQNERWVAIENKLCDEEVKFLEIQK